MSKSVNAESTGESRKVYWDDLNLTLSFTMKNGGGRYLSLFVPDRFMYCYVNLHYYLRGDASWEQFVRCLPLISAAESDKMN
jgi:hypothetical protein